MNIAGKKTVRINPKWVSFAIILFFAIISLSPLIINRIYLAKNLEFDVIMNENNRIMAITSTEPIKNAKFSLLGYRVNDLGVRIGPYGLGSTLLSILLP